MPRRVLPHLRDLSDQIGAILGYYCRILDDEFLFGAAIQIPQVATIFDRVNDRRLQFSGEALTLTELLTLIAYRYGFERAETVGFGGYAVVLGQGAPVDAPPVEYGQRRVLRLVPEHHVRDVLFKPDAPNDFDVRLDAHNEPIRDPDYPLLLSDLFVLPRHTTKLVFLNGDGSPALAGGYPARLHCQLLPEVRPFAGSGLDQRMALEAGNLLEAALATLGVSVADAHGGNGGALIGADGQPIVVRTVLPDGRERRHYVPVVLDYGYYSPIGARTLAAVLMHHGVTGGSVAGLLRQHPAMGALLDTLADESRPLVARVAHVIEHSGLPRYAFGRLLYAVTPPILSPGFWIDYAEHHWKTTKERIYPPLQSQARLTPLYPDYDEVLFPQRIEEYYLTL